MAHVWEKSYPSAVRWDIPLPPAVPLESLLESATAKWSDRTAIDFYDRTTMRQRRCRSYRQYIQISVAEPTR